MPRRREGSCPTISTRTSSNRKVKARNSSGSRGGIRATVRDLGSEKLAELGHLVGHRLERGRSAPARRVHAVDAPVTAQPRSPLERLPSRVSPATRAVDEHLGRPATPAPIDAPS